ncbi:MAG: amidohydrolase family protein [Acidobacteriota bacterium]|nr:amidohydrolase family protein [Acidobacteriota bacterium]
MSTISTLVLVVLISQGFIFSQQVPELVAEQGYADMILINGKIVTMDDWSIVPNTPGRIVEAMAIKGKKIMALGTNQQMRELAGPATQFVDVGGKAVIPGLIQTHYHLFGPAASRFGPQVGLIDPSIKVTVVAEATAEGTSKKIRDSVVNAIEAQSIPKGQWISVSLREGPDNRPATNRTWLYRGLINRRTVQLDSAAPDHPVVVGARQAGIFNAAAIRAFKEVFPDWEESTMLERGRSSAARDGYAAVPELQGLTFAYWWRDEPVDKLAEALRLHGMTLQKLGMTTVSTRLLFPSIVDAYNKLNREGKMPHRLSYYIEAQRGSFFNLKATREFYKGTGAPWTNHRNGGEMLWMGGMSNEVWDSSQNHVCLGPDVPASPEIKDRERCPRPGTRPWEAVKAAVMNGWRPVGVHGTSSHGVRLYIQMLEDAMKEANLSAEHIRGLRTTMEHNTVLGTPDDVMAKIKEYGIILNVNTPYLDWTSVLIKDYGEVLRPYAMPVKTWINQGIRVTFEATGTDFWKPIHTLITREITNPLTQQKETMNPEQAIDRVTALKMTTTWASEYILAEDTLGTLEPGKYADFVVLEQDFFTIPVEEIPGMQVIMTGLAGEIVYDRDQLAGM